MTAAMEKEREEFEIAMEKAFWPRFSAKDSFAKYPDGFYVHDEPRKLLKVWQLARASISPQVPVEAIRDAITCMEQEFSLFARSIEEHPSPNTKELTDELERWGRSIESLRALLPGGEK